MSYCQSCADLQRELEQERERAVAAEVEADDQTRRANRSDPFKVFIETHGNALVHALDSLITLTRIRELPSALEGREPHRIALVELTRLVGGEQPKPDGEAAK